MAFSSLDEARLFSREFGKKLLWMLVMSTGRPGVIRGLDPRIHHSSQESSRSGWIAGSSPAMTTDYVYREKKFGADAARPTLPGGRGGGGATRRCKGAPPTLEKSPNDGDVFDWIGRSFFGFGGGGVAITAVTPSEDDVEAIGTSPLACSRPTSRRGQTKSSARPAGALNGSPLTSVRAASASTAAGREPGPPSNWSVPTEDATSGRIGPASGRGAGLPGSALASGVAGSLGSAIGAERPAISRVTSRST